MIAQGARVHIERIPLARLLVQEVKPRYVSMVLLYVEQLLMRPHDDAGLIRVFPSKAHPGLFVIDDGHHKFCASIIAGRTDALCVVIEEEP